MLNSKPAKSSSIVGKSQLTCLLMECEYNSVQKSVQIAFVAASFTQGLLCLAVWGGFLSHSHFLTLLMLGSKSTMNKLEVCQEGTHCMRTVPRVQMDICHLNQHVQNFWTVILCRSVSSNTHLRRLLPLIDSQQFPYNFSYGLGNWFKLNICWQNKPHTTNPSCFSHIAQVTTWSHL